MATPRPRILLVPSLSELEWTIRPSIEEWAEVASYEVPGAGDEPPPNVYTIESLVGRGLRELDRRGWDECVIAADEFASQVGVRIASEWSGRVAGLALGHPSLSLRREGERAPLNGPVMDAYLSLIDLDYATYARHQTQITQGAYDDELVERFMRRVPVEVVRAYMPVLTMDHDWPLEARLREVGAPLLLAKHEGCLAYTDEGFDDAVAAFPDATALAVVDKPTASPDFARALRDFCESLGS
jgi:hypothetical protein